jgi:hypothetical protein
MKYLTIAASAFLIAFTACSDKKTATVEGEGGKKLELTTPGKTTIKQGATEKVTVAIKRTKFDEPVKIEFTNLPEGVSVKETDMEIKPDATKATFTLTATGKAPLKKGHAAKVSASGAGMTAGPEEFVINIAESD